MLNLHESSSLSRTTHSSHALTPNTQSLLVSDSNLDTSFALNRSSIKVVRPNKSVDGRSQAEWGDFWWETVHTTPSGTNPLTSDTNFARTGSVQMLAGAGFGETVVRSIQVDDETYLFAPIVTWQIDEAGLPPDWSAENSRYFADAVIDAIRSNQDLFYEVNGESLIRGGAWRQHRQRSPEPFGFTVPEDHYVGPDSGYTEGLEIEDSVSDGYWVMLNPLPVGNHTIHFGGSFDFSRIEVEDLDGDGQIGFEPSTTPNPTADQFTEYALQMISQIPNAVTIIDVTYNVHVVDSSGGNSCNLDLSTLVS